MAGEFARISAAGPGLLLDLQGLSRAPASGRHRRLHEQLLLFPDQYRPVRAPHGRRPRNLRVHTAFLPAPGQRRFRPSHAVKPDRPDPVPEQHERHLLPARDFGRGDFPDRGAGRAARSGHGMVQVDGHRQWRGRCVADPGLLLCPADLDRLGLGPGPVLGRALRAQRWGHPRPVHGDHP